MYILVLVAVLVYSIDALGKRKVKFAEIEPIHIHDSSSNKFIVNAIKLSLLDNNWQVQPDRSTPNSMTATLVVKTHSLTTKITISDSGVSFEYLDSSNLRYLEEKGNRYIHSSYFAWMEALRS